MRDLDAAEITAIQAGNVVARDFVWFTVIDRDTGDPASLGYWNGSGNKTIDVKDGRTGATESRSFYGEGELLQIGSIPLVADITIRTLEITLSQIAANVQLLVRGYDVRGAPMQLYRGYFDPSTRALVATAKPRFVGYVDGAPIVTPKENEEGSITLKCVSTTRELTRTNADVRSHESQLARAAGDDFYKDVGLVGEWDVAWGVNRSPASSAPRGGPS